jgi:prepilin-type N-terminal cleavage/methylation domain-containing protein
MRRLKKIFLNESGFTLIELLIVIALMGVLFIPINDALGLGLKIFGDENENIEKLYDGDRTLEMISEKIRKAEKNTISFNSDETRLIIGDEEIYFEDGNIISEKSGVKYTMLEDVVSFDYDNIFYLTENGTTHLEKFDVEFVIDRENTSEINFGTTFYLRN